MGQWPDSVVELLSLMLDEQGLEISSPRGIFLWSSCHSMQMGRGNFEIVSERSSSTRTNGDVDALSATRDGWEWVDTCWSAHMWVCDICTIPALVRRSGSGGGGDGGAAWRRGRVSILSF